LALAQHNADLVHQVCFCAIPDLLVNKHIVVRHLRYPSYVRLDPEAMQQFISGDDILSVRVTYHELVTALVACVRLLWRVYGSCGV